jgi:hypothetical protein
MKMFRLSLFAIAALGLIAGTYEPAQAGGAWMCRPITPASGEAKRVVNPNTSNAYTTNGRGCAVIANADIGFFLSQGYQFDPFSLNGNQVIANTQIGSLPAGAYIDSIIVQETSGGAVTGGLDIGTATGGTQIVSALTCGASCLVSVADTAILKRVFSSTAPTAVWVQAHTNFTSGPAINVTIHYSFF